MVSAIGAAESQPFDVGAPKRIDGDAAIRLVEAAASSGVQQFVMVTALGTGKFGWPASKYPSCWTRISILPIDTWHVISDV